MGTQKEFEFGETRESEAFFDRNPKFMAVFLSLMELANRYLGDRPVPKNQVEDICFGLGHACREDFSEVIFLAVNGYGTGASKLTRGLYERCVALAYMVQDRRKVDRFIRYAAVQEHKLLVAALKVVTAAEFDLVFRPPNTVEEIQRRYREIKQEFEMEDCKECGTKRTNPSWDLDVASMVQRVGGPYQGFYLPNYALPTLAIHATLSSATLKTDPSETHHEADLQAACASFLMVLALRSLEGVFHLDLVKEIDACEQSVNNLRPQRDKA